MGRRRRWWWLVAALLLIAAGAWLSGWGDRRKPPEARVKLPTHMDDETWTRAGKRRVPVFAEPTPEPEQAEQHDPRDPLLAAIPGEVKKGVVVLEANALFQSPVGHLLLDCLAAGPGRRGFERMKSDLGIDPARDLDRVALLDDTLVVTGAFGALHPERFLNQGTAPPTSQPLGTRGRVFAAEGADSVLVQWGDSMVMMAPDLESARTLVDRIEGRQTVENPVLTEAETYGEVYGVLAPSFVTRMFANDRPEIAQRLESYARSVTLHVDASHDVGVVADVTGDRQGGDELARTLGAALSLGRIKARTDGEADLAELLDVARVRPGGEGFRVEMGLPLRFFEDKLRNCVERGDGGR